MHEYAINTSPGRGTKRASVPRDNARELQGSLQYDQRRYIDYANLQIASVCVCFKCARSPALLNLRNYIP